MVQYYILSCSDFSCCLQWMAQPYFLTLFWGTPGIMV